MIGIASQKATHFFYDFDGSEDEISQLLLNSPLTTGHQYLIMEYGFNGPIIRVSVNLFIGNWYAFIKSAIQGAVVLSEDGKCVMEFSDDSDFLLYSNFEMQRNNGS